MLLCVHYAMPIAKSLYSCVLLLLYMQYADAIHEIHEIHQHFCMCVLQCQSMTFTTQACWLKHWCAHC
jgi:hypothetical protein